MSIGSFIRIVNKTYIDSIKPSSYIFPERLRLNLNYDLNEKQNMQSKSKDQSELDSTLIILLVSSIGFATGKLISFQEKSFKLSCLRSDIAMEFISFKYSLI